MASTIAEIVPCLHALHSNALTLAAIVCRDLRLAAITGELGLGNVREASDDQVRAVQHALALEGVGLSPRHLDAIRNSLTKTLVNPSGRPAQSIPMLAGAI